MGQFLTYVFGDIIIVYNDQTVVTSGTSTNPLWIPPWVYNTMNICWAVGYNYNDLTINVDMTFKYPSCYKMVVHSLTSWT